MMETIPERLDWLWFLGYDIDDEIPDHSVLSKARRRWGEEVFRELFCRVVRQAVEVGLVDGEKIFVDASLVEADASKNSVKKLDDIKLDEQYHELMKRLDERGEDGIGKHGKVNRRHISSTDPDATITSQSGVSKLSYKVHRSVDEQEEIITSCFVTTGAVNEAHVLGKTIADHKDAVGKTVKTVVADSKYGTKENYQALKGRGVKTHIKNLGAAQAARAVVFGKDRFTYVAERDVYVCPAGKELRRRSWNRNRQWMKYRIDKEHCASCELRSQCTNDKNGRSLNRTPGDDCGRSTRCGQQRRCNRLKKTTALNGAKLCLWEAVRLQACTLAVDVACQHPATVGGHGAESYENHKIRGSGRGIMPECIMFV